MRVLVVLPTYNEAENIEAILRAIDAARERGGSIEVSVLVVDDGSPDGTAAIARRVAGEIDGIHVMLRPGKAGLGTAYKEGFVWGLERGFDCLLEMDSDFSHDPGDILRLVEPLAEGFDLAVGSRYVPGGEIPDWPWYRWAISRGGNVYAAAVLGFGIRDATSGYRAYSAAILSEIDLPKVKAEGYGFQIEMVRAVLDSGGKATEVPIRFVDRQKGKSKMSSKIVIEAFLLVSWWGLKKAFGAGALSCRRGRVAVSSGGEAG